MTHWYDFAKETICDVFVYCMQSVNILNWPAQQMMHNFEVERRNVEKYKNRLGEIYQERLVAIDHVKS